MRVAYLDCASGISGDMTLGALVDAGIDLKVIQAGIDSLGLPSCQLEAQEVKRQGFRATKIHVHHEPEHVHRHLHHITDMIDASQLTEPQQELARKIFTRLGEAESHVHGTTIQKVHFHEVGAVDSIADIVGSAIGWDLLGVDRIVCSAIPTGHGTIEIAHGKTSIPAPATTELLKGIPLNNADIEFELTTPTGAAIVATVVDDFGHLPAMTIKQIGCGAGDKDLETQANVLRLILGDDQISGPTDRVWALETNLDDVPGELVGHCLERLLKAGALDVYATPIQMKKNRPAIKLTVLCDQSRRVHLESIIFKETTTVGIRRWETERSKLPRELIQITTKWGNVTGKRVALPDGEIRFYPEYEDCRQLAAEHNLSLRQIQEAAVRAFLE